MMDKEREFLKALNQSGTTAYSSLISEEARFFRSGEMPFTTTGAIREMLGKQQDKQFTCIITDGAIASTGDLGYVYGKVTIVSPENGVKQTHQANYLRIWKKEDGKSWKIVVDVTGE
jgi:ketosteroid isomerase-like protein